MREDEWIAASDRQPPSREDLLKDEAKWDQEFQYRRRIFGPSDARGEILSCVRKDLAATELLCVKSGQTLPAGWVQERSSTGRPVAYNMKLARLNGPPRTPDFARKLKELLGPRPTGQM